MKDALAPAVVTGACGFMGRHLVSALLREGRQVFALARHPDELSDLRDPLLRVIGCPRLDPGLVAGHVPRGASLFHLASVRSGTTRSNRKMTEINELATVALARAAARLPIGRFVYVSTALVFGASHGEKRTETDQVVEAAATNSYLRTKVRAHLALRQLARDGLPLVTVCPAIVFGPDHPTHPNRLTSYMRRLTRWPVAPWVAGGGHQRTLAYIDDVVAGILRAEYLGSLGGEYILGGDDLSPKEFFAHVCAATGRRRLGLGIPWPLASGLARIGDLIRAHGADTGYLAALKTLAPEWRYSSRKAEIELGYTWTAAPLAIGQTVAAVLSNVPPAQAIAQANNAGQR